MGGTKLHHAAMRVQTHFWLREARRLATAAQILALVRRRHLESYLKSSSEWGIQTHIGLADFWLMGSALEAILKADRARKLAPPPEPPTQAWIEDALKQICGHSHDLVKIAQERGLTLDERERVLLGYISAVVVWRARYSLPKRLADFEEPSLQEVHWQALRAIVQRAADQFGARIDLDELQQQALVDIGVRG